MTKKRFIKLLMSNGISRNDANRYAWFASSLNTPFKEEIKDPFYGVHNGFFNLCYDISKTKEYKI